MRVPLALVAVVLIAIPCFQNCSGAVFSGGTNSSSMAAPAPSVPTSISAPGLPVPPISPVVAASPTPAPVYFQCSGPQGPQVQNVTDATLVSSLGSGNKVVIAGAGISLPAQPGCGPACTTFYLFSGGTLTEQNQNFAFDSQLTTLSSGKPICVVRTDGAPSGVNLFAGATLDIGCSQRATDGTAGVAVAEVSFEYNSAQVVSYLMCLNTSYSDPSNVTVGDLKTVFGSALTVQ